MSKISEEDAEMLARKLAQALQQARSVSDSEHFDHHRFIAETINARKARTEFWNAMLAHVVKWGAISIVSFAGYAGWLALKHALRIPL